MTFREFLLEQGTKGEGPTASGQRGSSVMSPSSVKSQKAVVPNEKKKGGSFGGSTEPLKDVPGSPLSPRGLGKYESPKPGVMGAGRYELAKPSPFANTMKYAKPQNLDWPKKSKS